MVAFDGRQKLLDWLTFYLLSIFEYCFDSDASRLLDSFADCIAIYCEIAISYVLSNYKLAKLHETTYKWASF